MADDDIRRFNVLLEDIAKQVRVVAEGYGALNTKVDGVTAQLQQVDLKIDRLDIRAGALENRMGAVENRIGAVEHGVKALENRMSAVEHGVTALDGRLGAVERHLAHGAPASPTRPRRSPGKR